MALSIRLTIWLAFSRLVSVLVCLCAFTLLPLPQFGVLTSAESTERECPAQEDGENSEEELVVCSSACRRLNDRCQSYLGQHSEAGERFAQTPSNAYRLPAIVGHQLANGLCAPWLI